MVFEYLRTAVVYWVSNILIVPYCLAQTNWKKAYIDSLSVWILRLFPNPATLTHIQRCFPASARYNGSFSNPLYKPKNSPHLFCFHNSKTSSDTSLVAEKLWRFLLTPNSYIFKNQSAVIRMWSSVHGAKTYCLYFKRNKSLELIPISGFILFLPGFFKIPLRAPTLGLLETWDASLQLQSCVALRTVGSTAFFIRLAFYE